MVAADPCDAEVGLPLSEEVEDFLGDASDLRRLRPTVALLEAELVLTGTEVKSLRNGKANIAESYATEEEGEIWNLLVL